MSEVHLSLKIFVVEHGHDGDPEATRGDGIRAMAMQSLVSYPLDGGSEASKI